MSSARVRNTDAPIAEYERQKWANMARNKEKLESLALPKMDIVLQPFQTKKEQKLVLST